MIVIVCPGQGAQTPGFLAPWCELEGIPDALGEMSDACGVDLIEHGTDSDAETIRDTAIAQPLIVAAGLVTLRALRARAGREAVTAVAGHSVGEVTAAAAAGVFSEAEAVRFVHERAVAMAAAAAQQPTGMTAVLGGDPDEVVAAAETHHLEPANFNGGGQIVVAGAVDDLAAFAEEPPARTRVVPLQVAGAFHTRYMRPARESLAAKASSFQAADPSATLWSNHDGAAVTDGGRFLELLVEQVASPVRWDRCMESFQAAGVTGLIEVAPAGTLVGLARRGLKGLPTVAVKTPDDLDAAYDMLTSTHE